MATSLSTLAVASVSAPVVRLVVSAGTFAVETLRLGATGTGMVRRSVPPST